MDYFKVFLEEYSKHHDRELRLLEQEGDPRIAKASQVIANGDLQQSGGVMKGTLPKADGGAVEATLYSTGSIVIGGANAQWDGNTLSTGKNQEQFKKILTMLAGEEGADTTQDTTQETPVVPVNPIDVLLQDVISADPATRDAIAKEFETARSKTPGDLVKSSFGESQPGKSLMSMNVLLKSLVNPIPVVTPTNDGLFKVEDRETNYQDSLDMAEAVNELIDEVKERGEEVDEEKIKEICGKFKATTDGQVVIFTGNENKGRVFYGDSQNNTLNFLRNRAGCGDPEKIDLIERADNLGAENNIRGTVIEPIGDLWTILRHLRRDDLTGAQRTKAEERMSNIRNKLLKGIRSLDENNERWLQGAMEAAVPEADAADYQLLHKLFGDDGKYMKALYHVAAATNRIRKPDITMGVGDQVKYGNKQDSLEMWKDKEAAKASLKDSGVDDKVVAVKASEAFKGREEDLQDYIEMGLLKSADDILYVTDISYKTLIKDTTATTGGSTDENTDSFMTGGKIPGTKANYGLATNFRNKAGVGNQQGVLGAEKAAFDAIHQKQQGIKRSIDNLPTEWLTKTESGTVIKAKGTETVLDATIKKLQDGQTYNEFTNGEGKELSNLRKKYDRANEARKPAIEKEIKEKLKQLLVIKHLKKSIESTDPEVGKAGALYAAGLNYMAGASKRDSTVLQINVLDSMTSYTSNQNGEINRVIESIRSGDGEWKPKVTKNGVSFHHKDKYRRAISVSYDSSGKGKWEAHQTSTSYKETSNATKNISTQKK